MYCKIITTNVTRETEEGQEPVIEEVKSIQTLDVLPKEAIIQNFPYTYKEMVERIEEYTEEVEESYEELISEAVYEEREVTDEEGNVLVDEEGNVIKEQIKIAEPVYETKTRAIEVPKQRVIREEVEKQGTIPSARVFNPNASQLEYQVIQPEERENYTWELQIVNDEIEVVYTAIPQPTEEELAEQARLEAEAQAEAERIAEEKAEQARLQAIANREARFNSEFFKSNTLNLYIRRKFTTKTGEVKDFLTDAVPMLALGLNAGETANIIGYEAPADFNEDYELVQHIVSVNNAFIAECMNQLNTDFYGA